MKLRGKKAKARVRRKVRRMVEDLMTEEYDEMEDPMSLGGTAAVKTGEGT